MNSDDREVIELLALDMGKCLCSEPSQEISRLTFGRKV